MTGERRPLSVVALVLAALAAGAIIGTVTSRKSSPVPAQITPTLAPPTPTPAGTPTRGRGAPTPRPTPTPYPAPRATSAPKPTPTPEAAPPLQRGLRSKWYTFTREIHGASGDLFDPKFLKHEAIIPAIDFKDEYEAPFGMKKTYFSFEAEALLHIPVSGRYHFIARADDGMKVTIADRTFGDLYARGDISTETELLLEAGLVPVRVQYAECDGPILAQLDWVKPSGVRERIPPEAFHSPASRTPRGLETAWSNAWTQLPRSDGDDGRAASDIGPAIAADRPGVETFLAPVVPVALPFATDFSKLADELPAPWRTVRRDVSRFDASGRDGGLALRMTPDDSLGPRTDLSNLVAIKLDREYPELTVRVKMRFPEGAPNQWGQQAGIFLARDWSGIPDQDNYIRVVSAFGETNCVRTLVERTGEVVEERVASSLDPGTSSFWLEVRRNSGVATVYASSDGERWVAMMEFIADVPIAHVGVFASTGDSGAPLSVVFESVEVLPEAPPRAGRIVPKR